METVLEQVCASCGNHRLPDGDFCLFCGDVLAGAAKGENAAPPLAMPHLGSASLMPPNIEYAGFWLRFWAGSVDLALEALGALLLTLAIDVVLRRFGRGFGLDPWETKVFTGVAYILILAVGSWLYCAFAESSRWRATVGKRLLGLQVVTLEGERTSFGQATARHFMKFLSLFCLTIGFLMSGWTKRRQALHDMPCDVVVIRTPATPPSLATRY